ncbi:MAG TPA: hypothetical protein VM580_02005 [Labilithrix sp.]|nr:hypothetical protein [Labilithrix sp.]
MNRYLGIATVLLVAAAAFGCSPPPKVLVGHNFAGSDKSVKVMLQDSGQVDKANNRRLFNVFVRMCDVTANSEASCKDTQVLDNVVPGSVY